MNKLRQQFRLVIYSSVVLCAGAYILLTQLVPQVDAWLQRFEVLNISWPAIPALIIWMYERFGWRIFNPRLDYTGQWEFTEKQYARQQDGSFEFVLDASGHMRIRQDPNAIAIVEGRTYEGVGPDRSDSFATWYSVACDVSAETGRVAAALHHDYSSVARQGGPIEFGVETINVVERDRFGRPTKLQSKVVHTVGRGEPRQIECMYTKAKPKPASN